MQQLYHYLTPKFDSVADKSATLVMQLCLTLKIIKGDRARCHVMHHCLTPKFGSVADKSATLVIQLFLTLNIIKGVN